MMAEKKQPLDTELLEQVVSQLIPLSEAAKLSGLSSAHLRRLISQNAIWAARVGYSWVTTKESIQAYLDTNPRPGPKPKNQN